MGCQERFKALSDPIRRQILELLQAGAKTAGEMSSQFSMSAATISHHLAVLRDAGLVQNEKRGKFIDYTLNIPVVDELIRWFAALKKELRHENAET